MKTRKPKDTPISVTETLKYMGSGSRPKPKRPPVQVPTFIVEEYGESNRAALIMFAMEDGGPRAIALMRQLDVVWEAHPKKTLNEIIKLINQ